MWKYKELLCWGAVIILGGQVCGAASWREVTSPTENDFSALWRTAPNELVAVGHHGTFLRYQGSSWQPVPGNPYAGDEYIGYAQAWGTPDNLWIVGTRRGGPDNGKGIIMHYDGSNFNVVMDKEDLPYGVYTVWGCEPDDVWFGAGYHGSSKLYHYDGSELQEYPGWDDPEELFDVDEVTTIWGTASNNIYAGTGSGSQHGQILHYNGTDWTEEANAGDIIYEIWGSGTEDVWAVGNMVPNLPRYSQLEPTEAPEWHTEDCGLSWPNHLYAIHGSGPDNIWMGGYNGRALLWNGSGFDDWDNITPNMENIQDFWVDGPNNAWLVAADGLIMHLPEPTSLSLFTLGVWAIMRRKRR